MCCVCVCVCEEWLWWWWGGCWSNILLLKPTTLTPPSSPPPPLSSLPFTLLPHIAGSSPPRIRKDISAKFPFTWLCSLHQVKRRDGKVPLTFTGTPVTRGGYGVITNNRDDSMFHRSAAVESHNLPRAASTLRNLISDSRVTMFRILTGDRRRL